mmetsp:Transcript_15679/g.26012  ORF Transcript_15679/g.26012 Transcript_15679/m.26012 type:complete len:132 (-) Transcript_15679:297-692(-)
MMFDRVAETLFGGTARQYAETASQFPLSWKFVAEWLKGTRLTVEFKEGSDRPNVPNLKRDPAITRILRVPSDYIPLIHALAHFSKCLNAPSSQFTPSLSPDEEVQQQGRLQVLLVRPKRFRIWKQNSGSAS